CGAGVDHERGFGRSDASQRGKGAGEHGAGFKAGFADSGLVLLEDVARDGYRQHSDGGSRGTHDLEADDGVVNLKGHELLESEANDGQGLGELGGECVEVEQEDAYGGVRDDDGEISTAAVGADVDGFEGAANGCDDCNAVREVAGLEAGHDGAGSQRDARDGLEWAVGEGSARGRHTLGCDLAGQA